MKKLSSIIAEINSEYDRAVWNDELSKRKLSVIDECENCGKGNRLLDCLCFDCWKERDKITQKNEKKKDYSCCNNQAIIEINGYGSPLVFGYVCENCGKEWEREKNDL